ncbi:MAG TPA: VWA domain-containing protein, partial [Dehalococcoidia bacterium]
MNFVHRSAVFAVVALALVCSASTARAQEAQLRVTITAISDDSYPNARAIVGIENTGEAAPVLTAENFTIDIDGHAAPVSTAQLAASEDAPLDLLITFDTSGSMEGAPLASAKAAAKALIAELDAADRIALIHFGDEVRLAQDFTSDRVLINGAIDALVAQGNTALYQATAASAVKISGSPASRRAVVLLSDGADAGGASIATREEAIAGAAGAGVPYFTIAAGTELDLPYLQQVADVTRGRMLQAPRPEDLNALYVSIGRLLRSQYVVTFDASAASATDGVQVVITVKSGDAVSSAEARYTPGSGFLPTITISGVSANETLELPRDITAAISVGAPRLRWYVDDVNVLEQTAPPYIFTYDPARFSEGDHNVRAVIGDGAAAVESSVALKSIP